ncbi:MAG: hypothetical protein ABIS47_11295 [Acidimicrobiales bacterium]
MATSRAGLSRRAGEGRSWLVAADGIIFPFGDTVSYGRPDPALLLDGRALGLVRTPTGLGSGIPATRP